jgi:hypothetical protein
MSGDLESEAAAWHTLAFAHDPAENRLPLLGIMLTGGGT